MFFLSNKYINKINLKIKRFSESTAIAVYSSIDFGKDRDDMSYRIIEESAGVVE